MNEKLIQFLNKKVEEYNRPDFIEVDPIFVPHQFSNNPDREIAGFFSALFAWGNRKTIINKSLELMRLMDNAPYSFCTQHQEKDRKHLVHFKHRTFNSTDLFYFLDFLKQHYAQHHSLEDAFIKDWDPKEKNIERGLAGFYRTFFSLPYIPERTRKHIATPERKSACKRLNMYLRWMVRKDKGGVDFGIWKNINQSQLIIPVDVHVARVARSLNLISRKQNDWITALELTETLKELDPADPVKYDFALFAMGIHEQY
ncbi:MAG: TIGR02757 family protein [Chitinophagaceae bacterium]|nr:TIGR02757 family protein [Chitinophagaceae bacterium]